MKTKIFLFICSLSLLIYADITTIKINEDTSAELTLLSTFKNPFEIIGNINFESSSDLSAFYVNGRFYNFSEEDVKVKMRLEGNVNELCPNIKGFLNINSINITFNITTQKLMNTTRLTILIGIFEKNISEQLISAGYSDLSMKLEGEYEEEEMDMNLIFIIPKNIFLHYYTYACKSNCSSSCKEKYINQTAYDGCKNACEKAGYTNCHSICASTYLNHTASLSCIEKCELECKPEEELNKFLHNIQTQKTKEEIESYINNIIFLIEKGMNISAGSSINIKDISATMNENVVINIGFKWRKMREFLRELQLNLYETENIRLFYLIIGFNKEELLNYSQNFTLKNILMEFKLTNGLIELRGEIEKESYKAPETTLSISNIFIDGKIDNKEAIFNINLEGIKNLQSVVSRLTGNIFARDFIIEGIKGSLNISKNIGILSAELNISKFVIEIDKNLYLLRLDNLRRKNENMLEIGKNSKIEIFLPNNVEVISSGGRISIKENKISLTEGKYFPEDVEVRYKIKEENYLLLIAGALIIIFLLCSILYFKVRKRYR